MITVAVTGGIGSGKSTVSAALRERGAVVVDSDQLAREVVAPGTPGLAAIAERFGAEMVDADGALDRAALAAVVFADPASRIALEQITHPLVRKGFVAVQQAAAIDAIVVNDIPLLTTLEAAAAFHLVVGVRADAERRIDRLISRGLGEADARARMAAQLTDAERAPLCDVLIDNDGRRADVVAAVDALWHDRLLPFEENTRLARRAPRPGGAQLVDPQPRWATDAVRLAARASLAAGGARVDHIGSTAIPAMPAKDVIDLQLTVPDLATADALAEALSAAGFPPVTGIDQDTPHPVGRRSGTVAQAAAQQRRSWSKPQPPREGEGFSRLDLGIVVPRLVSRRAGGGGGIPGGEACCRGRACGRPGRRRVHAHQGTVDRGGLSPRPGLGTSHRVDACLAEKEGTELGKGGAVGPPA